MSLMEQFADPNYFEGLSMGERLTGATVTMCMGLGITFLVLIILWACIAIMAKLTNRTVKSSNAAPAQASTAPAPAAPVSAAPAPAVTDDEAADGELIAVIAAAVAAMENTVVSNLVVKKITRVSGPTNAWANAGLSECIDSRRM